MTDLPPPASVRERLIETVPILLGRVDASGVVQDFEGTLPNGEELGEFAIGTSNLLEMFPDFDSEIRSALGGRRRRFVVHLSDSANGGCHFEVNLVFDFRRKSGAYFLVHDITELHRLQVSLLECTDREQRRVGQDLHDTLGQELTGIGFLAENLRKMLAAGRDVSEELADIQQRLADALNSTRRIAWQLSPQLDGERLVEAFERLATHIRETFSIDCRYEANLDNPITEPSVAYNLFRIAQEACTNAVRHGEPATIRIHLSTGERNILEISDDGRGCDFSQQDLEPGMGISMMRFRANSIGGALRISSQDSGGTLVACRFANRPPLADTSANGGCSECLENIPHESSPA